ncbi:vesicle transporter [Plasmodium falciparum IGH-CR14]|uniref:Vesicle transporter n=1 Tax=Plasmodium falciparum IGH-CR14 TaxID=580059 RepID=A0A0L1IEU0_PLAFA|nr:vesicle transporter [Plasmodium falciparum IGH-CR14]
MLSVILNDDDINKEHIENIFFVHKVNDINVNAINNISNVLFFLRPYFYEIKNIFEIIDKIEKSKSTKRKNNYVFIFVPYMSYLCKQEILKYNVLDIPLKIILFPLYFFPLYNDVYSLEIKNLFKEYYVDNDFSNLIFCSFSLMFLQFLFNGVFKNIKSIGNLAQFSSEQLIQLRKEIMASNFNIQSPNDFQDDFYDILTNIQNFQDLKNFKNANDTTRGEIKCDTTINNDVIHNDNKNIINNYIDNYSPRDSSNDEENNLIVKREDSYFSINNNDDKIKKNEKDGIIHEEIKPEELQKCQEKEEENYQDEYKNEYIHKNEIKKKKKKSLSSNHFYLNHEKEYSQILYAHSQESDINYISENNQEEKNKQNNNNNNNDNNYNNKVNRVTSKKANRKKKKKKKKKNGHLSNSNNIAHDFMINCDNTKYLMKKKDRDNLEKKNKKEKNYLLEKIGISNFNFLLNVCDHIDSCIIIDRRVDMITPFCTPFTYEGLIDHFFGIDNLQIEIPRYIIFNEENKHVKYDMMENKDKKECNNNMINNNNMNNMNNYDNSYGNNNNIINKTMKVRVKLKSSVDVLYNDIKDLSQNEIGSFLHKKASDIQKTYKEKDSLKDIEEINQYMRIFKEKHYEHNSLSTHVNIASFILNNIKKEYNFNKLKLEDEIIQLEINTNKNILLSIVKQIQLLIYTNDDIYEVYRLLCLFSILTNGINQNYINELKKDIIEQYGIKELTRLNKLYTCNILKFNNKQKFLWTQLKNNFHLLSNDENDISYVCNGYAPLSVRLIEYMAAFKNNLQVFPEIFNLLNGPTLDIIQNPIGYETLPIQNKTKNNHINLNNTKKKKKNVLLFYIGGISYAEIASIRALNKKNQHYNYLIFTTEIVSSKKFLQSME